MPPATPGHLRIAAVSVAGLSDRRRRCLALTLEQLGVHMAAVTEAEDRRRAVMEVDEWVWLVPARATVHCRGAG